MARSTVVIQVFVASPSDLGPEREALELLVAELNRTWSKTLGVMLELVRWEKDVRPTVGSDPQDLINSQIANDYDVFIGMLWGRFGTPTPRAASGTHEEFLYAMDRRRREMDKPDVMVYFKDAPLAPSSIDPNQLRLVQDFRASLPSKGVLYSTFEDETSFQTSLRAHLSSLALKFADLKPAPSAAKGMTSSESSKPGESADDLGYFDYVEAYEARMKEMTESLTQISAATELIGQQVSARAKEIGEINAGSGGVSSARGVVKKSADDMLAYSAVVKSQVPTLSSSRDSALDALTRALALYEDFDRSSNEDLIGLRDSLVGLRDSSITSKGGILGLRDSVASLPRLTAEINRAKRSVLHELDELLSSLEKTNYTIDSIVRSIDQMMER